MITGFGDRGVAAAPGPEPMAAPVEGRVVVRAQDLEHRLLHDPVDHVRYAKAALTASCFRDPHPPDEARLVGTFEQFALQHAQDRVEALAHLVHALLVRPRSAVV
jgi:hypothetical protein